MTFPPTSMAAVGQCQEAAFARPGRASRMIRPAEHPPGCRCEEEPFQEAMWLLEQRLAFTRGDFLK